ncbi:MAG TPA: FHA domain-containing serine/threonine-protein kinase [Gemmataceae bacterium]|nr:FHA domain-containing serine/threonine-protein kinase [Gemmataceae bacterium]
MSLQFVIIAGPDKGKAFTLHPGPNLMLGRSAQAEYRLNDPRVSRTHCQVLREGDQVTVIDNNSSSGVLVNGAKVKQHVLKLGDVVQVGDTQLHLRVGDLPLDVALAAGPARAEAAKPVDKLSALSGQKLAHYDIGPVIGQGHSGVVFHANDLNDNRPVALKVLLPEFSRDEEEMQRFIRAMKTMMPLRHPNLVTLYGAGKTGPYCWVAMEYLAGENLQQVIQRIGVAGMLDWRHAFKVAVHVGRALAYAHDNQIIHRNVTPTNIILEATTKTAKLGDLMLAKALEGSLAQQITRPGEIVGDVAYMSPERTRGTTDVDGRSDLYGLGATVYALLTGRPPFEGSSLVEKITRIRQTQPEKPTKYQMSIPSRFEGAVLKLLEKRPEDRFQTAADLVKELERTGKLQGVQV